LSSMASLRVKTHFARLAQSPKTNG